MVAATIVICTHNRAAVIERAVRGALGEARMIGGDVVVVDNASDDDTAARLAALAADPGGFRVVQEPRLGLSAARNRGLAEARGEVLVYLDDDAVPRPGWLAALLAPYAAAEVACVGGRIVPHFPTTPPAWLTPALYPSLSGFDPGGPPRRLRLGGGEQYPYGANISFRVAPARAVGGFSTLLGPLGRRSLLFDETDLCHRLDHAGGEVRYAPDATVDHWVMPERLTPEWFLARHRDAGLSAATFHLRNRGVRGALGEVRWYHGRHLTAAPYAPREPIDAARFVAECRRREALGYLLGLARGLPRLRALRRGLAPTAA